MVLSAALVLVLAAAAILLSLYQSGMVQCLLYELYLLIPLNRCIKLMQSDRSLLVNMWNGSTFHLMMGFCFFIVIIQKMYESDSIKDESIQLLKEQATRLKMQNKEIQLRDEQIRFLKETMLALEQERDVLFGQNAQWKLKLKTMASEIAQYNANVVQKIYEENQELIKNVQQLEEELQTITQEKDDALKLLKQSQIRLQSQGNEKQQLSTTNQTLKQYKTKQEKRVSLLEKQNKQLQIKNLSLQRQLDQSGAQISYCSQQIDVLTQKHHDAVKSADKKYKQTIEKMVPREDFQRLEKEIKDAVQRNKNLRGDLDKAGKENQKLRFQLSAYKDKLLGFQIKQETKSQQLKIDLINLHQSIKLGKKISEFQSDQHHTASAIYELFKEVNEKLANAERDVKNYAERLKECEIQVRSIHEHSRFVEIQLERAREAKVEEEMCMQAEYQHKLMEINLRLKREEIALAGLKYKESQLECLKEQREKEGEEAKVQFQAMARTIEQLRKENFKLSDDLASTIKIFEESLVSRQCISHYKYALQDLVGIVFFLHLHLMRQRQRSMKIFKPFINYYLAIHPQLAQKRTKGVNRFRSSVFAVIAMIRMRKEKGKGKGIEWYAFASSDRRQKMQNLSQHIQQLSSTILSGGKAIDLLKCSEQAYKWKLSNYLRVKLPIGDDRKVISQCEFQLDNE